SARSGGSPEMEHAPLAPSAAERWLSCPGSPLAEQQSPVLPASGFATEGTLAHSLFAEALLHTVSPFNLTPDITMPTPLSVAVSPAAQVIDGRRFVVEQRVPPLPGLPAIWGTTDVVVFDRYDRVAMIIDLKFGRGILVEADAVQLMIYALLAAQHFGASPDGVTAAIIQPRAWHPAGCTRSHHHTTIALDGLLIRLRNAVAAVEDPDALRVPGSWCGF